MTSKISSPYKTDEYRAWDRERAKDRNKGKKIIHMKLDEIVADLARVRCEELGIHINTIGNLLIKSWLSGDIHILITAKSNETIFQKKEK